MRLRDLRCPKQDNRAKAKIINNLLRELRDAGIKLFFARADSVNLGKLEILVRIYFHARKN
jgi:hypothetical protein